MQTSLDTLLTRICSDGVQRLLMDVEDRYAVACAEPRLMPVTRREVGQAVGHTMWNFLLIGTPTGEFIAERALDGGLRLPAFAYRAGRRWNWSSWPAVLSFLHRTVQQELGIELLGPEPVATFPLIVTTGSLSRRREALVWIAQHSGRLKPRSGLTATAIGRPEQLELPHDQQLARTAVSVLTNRPPFPIAELDAATAEARPSVLCRAKRLTRSVLRTTPQPQRKWIFDQLKQLGVGPSSRVLDLACGDDPLASQIRQVSGARVAVNDLLWSNVLRAAARDPHLDAFNHDVRAFPITTRFDVVILKNLLHHLRSPEDHHQLYAVLRRIAATVLIVEVADPRRSAFYRWLHEHVYTDDINADGHAFLCPETLTRIVKSLSPSEAPEPLVREVFTLRGSYLLARISF